MDERPDPRPRVAAGDQGGHLLLGLRCESCGYGLALPRPRCPRCRGDLAARTFGPGGTVWSSTVVHIPVAGLEPPYALAYVDLDDDGPRVLAHVGGETAPPVGARVRLKACDERGDLGVEPA